MAYSLSYETEDTINVSQKEHSPITSSPFEKRTAPAQHLGDERVEDSLEQHPFQGGPVQEPQHESDDELYALSPKGKAALDAARSSAKQARTRRSESLSDALEGTQAENSYIEAQPEAMAPTQGRAESHNVIDDLLTNGATARISQIEKHRTQATIDGQDTRGDEGKLQASEDEHDAATGPRSRQSTKMTAHLQQHRADANNQPSVRAPTQSAAALLAAKRATNNAQSASQVAQQSSRAAPPPKSALNMAQPAAPHNSMSKKRSDDTQVPTRSDSKTRSSAQVSTAGQVPSHKKGVLAQTPGSQSTETAQAGRQRGGSQKETGGQAAQDRRFKTSNNARPAVSGTLKGSGVVSGSASSILRPESDYDMPDSPNAAKQDKPAKKGGSAGNLRSKKGAPQSRKVEAHASDEYVHGKRSKRKRQDSPMSAAYVAKGASSGSRPARNLRPRRTKAEAEDGTENRPTQKPAHPTDAERHRRAGLANKENNAPIEHHANDDESIEAFERVVVNFGDEEPQRSIQQVQSRHDRKSIGAQSARLTTLGAMKTAESERNHNRREIGLSQQDAIILSDRVQPSSPLQSPSVPPSPAPDAVSKARTGTQRLTQGPRTPAAVPSSPPVQPRSDMRSVDPALLDDIAARKTTIISFDKSGPRNQGSVSTKKANADSARLYRTSLPPRPAPPASEVFGTRTEPGASRVVHSPSVARSTRSTRTTDVPPSNVAADTGEALAAFINKPAVSGLIPSRASQSQPIKDVLKPSIATQHVADRDEFFSVDDFEGPTLVEQKSPAIAAHRKQPKDSRTLSQQAMPPPPPNFVRTPYPHGSMTVLSLAESVDGKRASKANEGRPTVASQSKRTCHGESADEPSSKRRRVSPALLPASAHLKSANASLLNREPIEVQSRDAVGEPKAVIRKASRQTSRGTVDIHGSPIPRDLVVPEEATALEVFSQQADLSFDQLLGAGADEGILGMHPTRAATGKHHLPSLSQQPASLSSNSKPRSASPHEVSRAVSQLVVEEDSQDRMLLRVQGQEARTDPFTSSESGRKEPVKAGTSSVLATALKTVAFDAAARRPKNEAVKDNQEDPDKTLVEPGTSTAKFKRTLTATTDSSSDMSAAMDEGTSAMRDIGAWRNALQPHQMNLFDELVNISHRLVAHLVEQETAARNVVNDYRRRGERIVGIMERSHAQEHQQSANLLKEKKSARKHLKDMSRLSSNCAATIAKAKQDRAAEMLSCGDELRKLDGLIAEHV